MSRDWSQIRPSDQVVKQMREITDLLGMNPPTRRCFECDRLLTAFGEAALHFREIKRVRLRTDSPRDEYRIAESKCQRLRMILLRHLNQHDREAGDWRRTDSVSGLKEAHSS